jgi:hypothetical protein
MTELEMGLLELGSIKNAVQGIQQVAVMNARRALICIFHHNAVIWLASYHEKLVKSCQSLQTTEAHWHHIALDQLLLGVQAIPGSRWH